MIRPHNRVFALGLILFLLSAAPSTSVRASEPEDTCRYFGEDFPQGAVICLATPDGLRQSRCAMELNNPSWKAGAQPCDPVRDKKPRTGGKALDYVREYVKTR